jgi:hypothetical protein
MNNNDYIISLYNYGGGKIGKNIFGRQSFVIRNILAFIVLITILYIAAQMNKEKYDKKYFIALIVLLSASFLGHLIFQIPGATILLRGPVGIILKLLFIYIPLITLFILMVLIFTNKF